MKPLESTQLTTSRSVRSGKCAQGSVLIIVLWVSFGLVSLALYFGHSMLFEYRATDQQVAGVQAELAIDGAIRYVSFVLTNMTNFSISYGQMPDTNTYRFTGIPVGEGAFWLIGRGDPLITHNVPVYGLVDEASKLNLNTATQEMLELLPWMTPQLAAAIIDWRDENEDISADGGAEAETYERRNPPYRCKNAPFESTEELRLVYGFTPEMLFREDSNLNGVLDPNENDGTATLPLDNNDGRLDPGILEYVTVWSREPNKRSDGSARISVNSTTNSELSTRLQELFGQQRANEITQRATPPTGGFTSLLQFYITSGMTVQEFNQVAADLTVTNATYVDGLININTASAAVLNCLPGIGPENGQSLVNYRQNKSTNDLYTVAWILQVLDQTTALQAAPYLTTFSYVYSADIVAVGNHGRGYRRQWVVIDHTEDAPKVIYRRDRGRLGWALGNETWPSWLARKESP